MKSKKGISALVETVLLVLVAITAVGIVWYAIVPLFKTPAETAALCLNAVDITSASSAGTATVVILKDINASKLTMNAYDATGKSLCTNSTTAGLTVGSTSSIACNPVVIGAVKAGVIVTGLLNGKIVACPEVIEAVTL